MYNEIRINSNVYISKSCHEISKNIVNFYNSNRNRFQFNTPIVISCDKTDVNMDKYKIKSIEEEIASILSKQINLKFVSSYNYRKNQTEIYIGPKYSVLIISKSDIRYIRKINYRGVDLYYYKLPVCYFSNFISI